MERAKEFISSVERPDLDEFLSALNGFLEKQTTPEDPSYLRFLEIFCRSVGSGDGHLLKRTLVGGLESVMSYGIDPKFDAEFNAGRDSSSDPCPLDTAFNEQRVVAIVELDKTQHPLPSWFSKLMGKYNFRSLVAVPLLGHAKPVGILCAYYRDVCLFDQGTLDRLMGIGRMVGAATEKSVVAGRVESHDAKEKIADDFLEFLTQKSFQKLQVFGLLTKIVKKGLEPVSLLCGPLRMENGAMSLTVVDGEKVPSSIISRRVLLPPLVHQKLITGEWAQNLAGIRPIEWGDLLPLFSGKTPKILCRPLIWQGKLQAAVIAWRMEGDNFNEDDELLLTRLASIASLALNTA